MTVSYRPHLGHSDCRFALAGVKQIVASVIILKNKRIAQLTDSIGTFAFLGRHGRKSTALPGYFGTKHVLCGFMWLPLYKRTQTAILRPEWLND